MTFFRSPERPSPPRSTAEDPLPGVRGEPIRYDVPRIAGGPWRNIVVRMPNWVGDVVMALPALGALRDSFPGARITLLVKPHLQPILAGEGLQDDWIPYRAKGLRAMWRLGRDLARRRFDLALLFTHSISSALVMRFAGIPRRVGYSERWLDPPGLLSHALHAPREGRLRPVPMVDYYLHLVYAVGAAEGSRRIRFKIDQDLQARADRFYREAGIAPGERVIGISPGASFGLTKQWRSAGFAEVADSLAREHDARVVILCGPNEADVADEVEEAMETPAINTARSIVPLDLLKPVVGRMMLLVCTDSGTRHFAVGTDVPVVVVMGSTYHLYTETEYEKYDIVHHKLDCWPCHKPVCPLGHRRCMNDLAPEPVLDACRAMLARYPPQGRPAAAR